MITIRRKRGDTFRLRFQREGGLEGVQVSATLTGPANFALVPTVIDAAAGVFELSSPLDTATWPTGRYACDIRYDRAGQTTRTQTFFVQLLEAITP